VRFIFSKAAVEIGLHEQALDFHGPRVKFFFHVHRRANPVVIEHAHLKSAGAAGQAAADSAEADDAERFSPDVATEKLVKIPPRPGARTHPGVAFDQAARDGHQQCPGKVRGGLIKHTGRVGCHHFVTAAGGDVDIVVADRNSGGDAQLRRDR
jgi:hypothetical protein